ncbi:MAG: glycosyltransferase family 39 protein [Caldilineales bacterium]
MQRLAPFPVSDKTHQTLALPGWTVPAWIAGIVVAGAALRVVWAFQVGLHPDEALYASWALRIADGSDPALLGVYVDKPPFLPYLLAAIAWLMGGTFASISQLQHLVVAGRLAGVAAGLISLALLWSIARPVYGRRVAAMAVALLAVSPLAARLSPSLLTDPWLVLFMLLGLWAALRGRPWLTGLACGLAFATKQQAVLIIPVVVAAYFLFRTGSPGRAAQTQEWRVGTVASHRPARAGLQAGTLWRLVCGFALIATVVLWWDSQRWQWMPSYWERSATTYGGLALVAAPQLAQHLASWAGVLATVIGLPLLLLAAIMWGGRLAIAIRAHRHAHVLRALPDSARRFDALLGVFLLVYLAVHLATSLAPWDRYALPLAPVLALLLARIVYWWADRIDQQGRRGAVVALAAVVAAGMLWAVITTASPRFPVADNSTYDGVPAIAGYIRDQEPPAAIVYHRTFGWHYGFYLYGADHDLRWWRSPADLARQAARQQGRQLVALPSAGDRAAVADALARRGLALDPVMTASHPDGSLSATLFSIEPLAGAATGD